MRNSDRLSAPADRHPHRPSSVAFPLFLLALTLFAATLPNADRRGGAGAGLVRELGLTDLALFTEARYTRHLSQADRHTPFQDHPLALDHFPSGSLVPPPARLRQP